MFARARPPLPAAATVLALLVIAPGCSSSLPSGQSGSAGSGGAAGGDIAGSGGTTGTAGSIGGGGSGGTGGGSCGYDLGACPPGQGCLWECFGDSFHGRCVPLPTACDGSLAPVCGCDGKTYTNECLLQSVPLAKDHDGACFVTSSDGVGSTLRSGTWSGAGIRMNVTEAGAAISFGCASGTIDQPLTLARRFYTVNGPLTWFGSWQVTMTGTDGDAGAASVEYQAYLVADTLQLQVMDQSWTLGYQDLGPPPCP